MKYIKLITERIVEDDEVDFYLNDLKKAGYPSSVIGDLERKGFAVWDDSKNRVKTELEMMPYQEELGEESKDEQ